MLRRRRRGPVLSSLPLAMMGFVYASIDVSGSVRLLCTNSIETVYTGIIGGALPFSSAVRRLRGKSQFAPSVKQNRRA